MAKSSSKNPWLEASSKLILHCAHIHSRYRKMSANRPAGRICPRLPRRPFSGRDTRRTAKKSARSDRDAPRRRRVTVGSRICRNTHSYSLTAWVTSLFSSLAKSSGLLSVMVSRSSGREVHIANSDILTAARQLSRPQRKRYSPCTARPDRQRCSHDDCRVPPAKVVRRVLHRKKLPLLALHL